MFTWLKTKKKTKIKKKINKYTSGYFTPARRHSKQFLLQAHHSYLFINIFKNESMLFMLVVFFFF